MDLTHTDALHISKENGCLTIQFKRLNKLNALNQAMYSAMNEALTQAKVDNDIRVILFTGTPTCFTSGNDIQDFLSKDRDVLGPILPFLHALNEAPKPIVAAVNGPAVGIGTTLLLHCDLVIAGQDSYFQMPFVNLGLCPEAGSSVLLPRQAGHLRASEWLLLGERITAEQAFLGGLVNEVVPNDQVMAIAMKKIHRLVAQPQQALQATKALLKGSSQAITKTIDEEVKLFRHLLSSQETHHILEHLLS